MAKTQTRPWDPAEHLETGDDMAAYLNVALEEGDLSLIMASLGDIARARRMASVAETQFATEVTGLGRESLYKSLSPATGTRSSPLCSRWCAPWGSGFRPRPAASGAAHN